MHNDQKSEEKILDGCLRRQPKSQRALVDKYSGYLFVTCKRYMNHVEVARDLVQDSLVKIFKNLNKFDQKKASFKSWITTITIRLCLSKLEKNRMTIVSIHDCFDSDVSVVDTGPLDNLHTTYLLDMISELPDGYREVFNMYAIDGYAHAEIAEYLKITTDVSRARLVRARKKLRIKIEKLNNEELWVKTT